VKAVFDDQQIEATKELTLKAVQDSLPNGSSLSGGNACRHEAGDFYVMDKASLNHGVIRAEQGFEPAEIAREHRLLRPVIFSELEEDLVQDSPKEVLWAIRLIDTVLVGAAIH
jgi:hypothetical protein